MNELSYALTAYYVESIDDGGLLDRLSEDGYSGNYLFTVNGRIVSRDLLDSVSSWLSSTSTSTSPSGLGAP